MYEEITKAIPRVKIMSGRSGANCRVFIDDRELKTAEAVDVHMKYGNMAEVTLKFTALIVNEEPKVTLEGQEAIDFLKGHK